MGKKTACFALIIALLCSVVTACAKNGTVESWTCSACGNEATDSFCSHCGQPREQANADSVSDITAQETPAVDIAVKTEAVEVNYQILSELPEMFTERRLSDDEVAALKNADLETLREKISTPADFAAWIDTQDGTYFSHITSNDAGQRTYGAEVCFSWWQQGNLGTPEADTIAVHVLSDDIQDIGHLVAVTDYENCEDYIVRSGVVIPTDGGYYIYSLDYETNFAQTSNGWDERIPLIFVESLEDIIPFFGSEADSAYPTGTTLTQLFYFPQDEQVILDLVNGVYFADGNAEELYRDDEYLNGWEDRTYGHIKPENIGNYQLSTMLGGTTLTAEEAYALLDCTPEEVKERVKTAGDMLMYMLAAQIGDCGGDRTKTINGNEWHYNLNAFQVMERRLGNCGSAANLANYLLEGDYDEIGFILHAYYIGSMGGHVYNYILYEGEYYIVDFSWYIFANYSPSNDFPVVKLSKLEDYKNQVNNVYGDVCMVLAHTSTGQHLPNVFDDAAGKYAVPEGAEYTVLYQESGDNCYQVAEYPLDRAELDWTSYQ